jgi:hypothetical protein
MRRWLDEGRVSGDSLVWREGWDDWKMGDTVFPSLQATPQTLEATVTEESLTHVGEDGPIVDDAPGKTRPKMRSSSKTSVRGIAIVVALSIVCIGLVIALLVVLQRQG